MSAHRPSLSVEAGGWILARCVGSAPRRSRRWFASDSRSDPKSEKAVHENTIYIYIYVCMHVRMYVHICVCACMYIYKYMYVSLFVYICVYACIYIYICVCVCVCDYVWWRLSMPMSELSVHCYTHKIIKEKNKRADIIRIYLSIYIYIL